MKAINNVMLDLETMGTGPNAAIIAVGAVRFDKEVTDRFYEVVDLRTSIDMGLEMDPDTVMWWMQQSDAAREQFKREGKHLSEVLCLFRKWIDADAIVWGNGAAFDNVILANAYRKQNTPAPWKFWNDRCYRTVKSLNPDVKMQRKGVYHCAVDDAESQALHLIDISNSK